MDGDSFILSIEINDLVGDLLKQQDKNSMFDSRCLDRIIHYMVKKTRDSFVNWKQKHLKNLTFDEFVALRSKAYLYTHIGEKKMKGLTKMKT